MTPPDAAPTETPKVRTPHLGLIGDIYDNLLVGLAKEP